MGYYFYLSEDHNVIVSHHASFLKKKFIPDGNSERKIELEEKVFEEHRVQEPEPNSEVVDVVSPSPHRSNRISYPHERYLGIHTEYLEKAFFMEDRGIMNDPKIYDEVMLDVDSEKWMEVM